MNIKNLSPNELIALSSSLSISLGKDLNSDELSLLAAFFTSFADNLALLSAKKSIEDDTNHL